MQPEYFTKYPNIHMERDADGVLVLRLHTNGGPFKFSAYAHAQFTDAFYDVGRDRDNRVVIFTGTGETWCDGFDPDPAVKPDPAMDVIDRWDVHFWEGKKLMQNLLDIEVPMIAAVNGPALIHSEYLLTCDILIASETAVFQDMPHLNNHVSPTDGVHVLWPHVLGPSRGRYFLLTQQKLDARHALSLGVAQEVVPAGQLMERARELAAQLAKQPTLTLRYARVGLTQALKKVVLDGYGLGLAIEALTAASNTMKAPKV